MDRIAPPIRLKIRAHQHARQSSAPGLEGEREGVGWAPPRPPEQTRVFVQFELTNDDFGGPPEQTRFLMQF